jgi:Outer membrane lipoprotein-sorting protein
MLTASEEVTMRSAVSTLVLLATLAATAQARDVTELLAKVASQARFDVPARADVRIVCEPDCKVTALRAILIGKGDTVYVEVEGGERALLTPDGRYVARDGEAASVAPGTSLAGTDVLLEDLAPFRTDLIRVPLISDDGPAGVVVTGAPVGPSAYELLVLTIDPERSLRVRTQYYQESVSNLTKIRRDTDFVQVGGHLRPGRITFETIRKGTNTRLDLVWTELPDAASSLFEPAGLSKPSGLTWPKAE